MPGGIASMSNVADFGAGRARSLAEPPLRNLALVAAAGLVVAASLTPGLELAVASMFYLGERQFLGEGVKLVRFIRFILLSAYVGACIVVVIGLFDFLSTVKVSLNEPAWSGFGVEAYFFAALVYFIFCYAMSRYAKNVEARLGKADRR